MKGFIGEFEELVLLIIAVLSDGAYGVPIKEEIENVANRKISLGALHATLARLEDKGFIESHMAGASSVRGGRRKRYFSLTRQGKIELNKMKSLRDTLWNNSKTDLSIENI